jgi:hypothetical protein
MSKLDKFLAKAKTYTIGGEELELKPLTVKDIDLLMKLEKEAERGDALKEIIKKTLMNVEGATEEKIDEMSLEHFTELVNAIMDVNGLEKPKTTTSPQPEGP